MKEITQKLIDDYVNGTIKTQTELAKLAGMSPATVKRRLRELNIQVGLKGRNGRKKGTCLVERKITKCKTCGKEMQYTCKYKPVYCSKKCQSDCLELQQAHSSRMLKLWSNDEFRHKQNESHKRNPKTREYLKYSRRVRTLTKHVYEKHKAIINPDNHPRTICGVDGGYQLDHIITIKEGFSKNLPPEDLAKVNNLRMLPWRENLMRQYKT